MSNQVLMAIDQGTTGTTVMLLDVEDSRRPVIIGRKTVDFKQHYPKPGLVEHDLEEIWQSVARATKGALEMAAFAHKKNFKMSDIAAIGITNQRETLCTFDRKTAKPLCKAIVWQDKRSYDICQKLKDKETFVRSKTGLVLDPYFSGTKMTWLMEQGGEVAKAIQDGTALFGTIDTYLLYRMTQMESFATEASNASRTLCFNSQQGAFDVELAKIFGLPHLDCFAQVKDSAGFFGKTKGLSFLPDGIPITGILGDQQAALAGQTCFEEGDAKCTYGTGAFMLRNIGENFSLSDCNLLTTVAWQLNGKKTYAYEGSAFIAGAAVQFMRDQLGFLSDAKESQELASEVLAAPEVYFVPALAGLGAPYWDPLAKGAFLGLTRGTTKNQMVRAGLEGIGFIVGDLFNAMAKDTSSSASLRVDGGAAANDLLMQFQSDILDIVVDRPKIIETTALGAALFAGLGVGMYSSIEDLKGMREVEQLFKPATGDIATSKRKENLSGWQRAVKAARVFHGHHD